MPPGLLVSRSSRCVACLVMAAGMALGPTAGAYGSGRPDAARSAPGPSHGPAGSPSPSAEESESAMAGRQAGEGRARPGRSLSPAELAASEASADEVPPGADPGRVPAFTPPPDAFPEPGRTARQRQALDEPAVRQVQQVSLGSGIALVGLGLGFLALRMRRMS
ncbi:hypothetical protein ACFPN0_16545 [Kitasatospora cinereorecta]